MLPDTAILGFSATGSPQNSSGTRRARLPLPGGSGAQDDTTGWYRFCPRRKLNNVAGVHPTTEPETLGELIADCADIPPALHAQTARDARLPAPRPWHVDEACHAQVADLDAYV